MGKMPLYTMLQKARSAGGWTMVAQLEGDAAGSQLLLLEGRPVWQRGDSTVLLQHLQNCRAAQQLVSTLLQAQTSLRSALARCRSW